MVVMGEWSWGPIKSRNMVALGMVGGGSEAERENDAGAASWEFINHGSRLSLEQTSPWTPTGEEENKSHLSCVSVSPRQPAPSPDDAVRSGVLRFLGTAEGWGGLGVQAV